MASWSKLLPGCHPPDGDADCKVRPMDIDNDGWGALPSGDVVKADLRRSGRLRPDRLARSLIELCDEALARIEVRG